MSTRCSVRLGLLAAALGLAGLVALRRRRRRLISLSSPPPTALFFGPATQLLEPVRKLLSTQWRLQAADDDSPLAARHATALVGGLALANAMLREAGPQLKLLQCHFTGTDWLDKQAVPSGVVVCNATGQEVAIAEWVVGAILRHVTRAADEDAAMRTRCAAASAAAADLGFAPPFFSSPPRPTRKELSSCTVGIVGFGAIGAQIAARLAPFGCKLIATVGRATPPARPRHLLWLRGSSALPALLQQSDFVVLTCPLTEKTKGLIGAAEFRLMKQDTYLVNVARGPIVDEDALYSALRNGRIAGAAIDVWYRLPAIASGQVECAPCDLAKHPFHELHNVLLSPHTSGWSNEHMQRRIAIVSANLDAVAQGRTPSNVVYRVE
ncbi:hypothetical protein AB1Y20_003240 [Prymnesium parvum]|uniref:D-isomer specific 2-hydroxyacid dehydrogenase NAD-binding domain-containing protein n=1 Tax=Prymnesium parvum TaxID=97485 RepID=A0AB34JA95_PRYPA